MPKKSRRKRGHVSDTTREINSALKAGRLLIGSNSVLRELKKKGLERIVCASNLPEAKKRNLGHYSSVSGVEITEFGGDSAKLGETCGKPFSILLVGIKK